MEIDDDPTPPTLTQEFVILSTDELMARVLAIGKGNMNAALTILLTRWYETAGAEYNQEEG